MRFKPRVIDLFSGSGLFSYAFQQSGFEIVQAVELNRHAAQSYARNVGDHIEVGDVTKISPRSKCEVLIAGPPCQGFSTLGKMSPDDPRNRLSFEVVRWARIAQPKIIVIENVAAFLTSTTWREVSTRLKRIGYDVKAYSLDAADYGVPQLRRRSFTIATLDIGNVEPPEARRSRVTVRQAWEGLRKRPDGRNGHFAPKPSQLALERMSVIPAGGDKRDVMKRAPRLAPPSWWRTSCEVTDAWGRMEWDKPSNTLRTCLQNPSKGRYIHPSQHRVITLREAARLHSIPDSWELAGFPSHVAMQIGNSVPFSLGTAVAMQVHSSIG